MRVTKGHTGNRRSHHSLSEIRLSVCSNCGEKHERHKVCLACGFYKGKKVLEVRVKQKIVSNAEDLQKDTKKTVKKIETENKKTVFEAPKAKAMKKVQNKG